MIFEDRSKNQTTGVTDEVIMESTFEHNTIRIARAIRQQLNNKLFLLLDNRILWKTIGAILKRQGAY
jgi:hypothetical protein